MTDSGIYNSIDKHAITPQFSSELQKVNRITFEVVSKTRHVVCLFHINASLSWDDEKMNLYMKTFGTVENGLTSALAHFPGPG